MAPASASCSTTSPRRVLPAMLCACALAACAGNVDTTPPTTTTGGTGASGGTGGKGIAGSFVEQRYHSTTGTTEAPHALSAASIRALVEAKEEGTFHSFVGVGHDDGTFEIPDVPEGPYWLAIDDTYRLTTSRTPILGMERCGRADAPTATAGVEVNGKFSGLEVWDSDDFLYWSSSDLEALGGFIYGGVVGAGDTEIKGELTWYGGLADASKGDVFQATQAAVRQSAGGLIYRVATRSQTFSGLSMTDGQSIAVQGALAPMEDAITPIEWALTDFLSRLTEASPGVEFDPFATGLGLFARKAAPFCGELPLIEISVSEQIGQPADDIDLGPVAHGALPGWSQELFVRVAARTEVLAPGATEPSDVVNWMWARIVPGPGAIVPVLSPVLDLRVNGQDGYVPATAVGESPLLSWAPPAVGSAAWYSVRLVRVHAEGTMTMVDPPTHLFITSETSVRLPPGILLPGEGYVFRVEAHDTDVEPFLGGFPGGLRSMAIVESAVMVP